MVPSSKALVVKLSSLGDLFHALPAVRMLKAGLGLSIHWMTQPEYAELVSCFDDVERVLTFPRRNFVGGMRSWLSELRADSYDYVFDFQGLFKSALSTRMARARRRVGPSYSRECARLLYHEIAGKTDRHRHAVEEALDFVRHFNVEMASPVFPVSIPSQVLNADSPRIAYLPCSRWSTKNWPPAHFARLIRTVHAEVGGSAYLLGGQEDEAVCHGIQEQADIPLHNVCGKTSLVELGGYLKEMDLLVTVDSGPMHMAAALGTPVLALFGATDPKRTGPYGPGHRVLQHGGLPCRPCRSRACLRAEKDIACLRDLHPDRVAESVYGLLNRNDTAWH